MKRLHWFLVGFAAFLWSVGGSEPGARWIETRTPYAFAQQSDWESKKIVPFVPSSEDVVEKMLELAEVKKGDVVYDLGSGDGRIVIAAAKKYGVRAVGFEIDPKLVKESRERIRREKLERLAEIRQQDILTVDLSPASVVTMYLLPDVNLKLRPKIWSQLKPGSRVVSHDFDMGEWQPEKTVNVDSSATVYLWRIMGKEGIRQ
ncbi:MAG: methyltransferase domain-containing protein [Deltaproteobacteria bacterium]|nr:methyltransferase domain-containing protein [Deltaproteobacteria bacterium]